MREKESKHSVYKTENIYASKYLIDQLLTPLSQLDKIVELDTEDDKLKNF